MKKGRTMKQAIKEWNDLKKGKVGKKKKAAKPKKTVKKKKKPANKSKKRQVTRILKEIRKAAEMPEPRIIEKRVVERIIEKVPEKHELSDEELALRMTKLYFDEVARLGHKASMDLDSVINTYSYALNRIERKDKEMQEIIEAIKKDKLRSNKI